MHNDQLYIKHKQERPEYIKTHKANYSKAININKVYIIREDDVNSTIITSCFHRKNTRGVKISLKTIKSALETEAIFR